MRMDIAVRHLLSRVVLWSQTSEKFSVAIARVVQHPADHMLAEASAMMDNFTSAYPWLNYDTT